MTQKDREFVNGVIYRMFLPIVEDSIDCGNLADAIIDEVVEDIEECADPDDWNSEDIRIGIVRVLKNKLNID